MNGTIASAPASATPIVLRDKKLRRVRPFIFPPSKPDDCRQVIRREGDGGSSRGSNEQGIGDCICRFGLPGQVLSISPDGQYIVAGWIAGKGSEPLAVYRVSDRTRVATLDNSAYRAIWDRAGHRLFLSLFGTPAISWTPEAGTSSLTGAADWSYVSCIDPGEFWPAS
jgi:hypothetical protein